MTAEFKVLKNHMKDYIEGRLSGKEIVRLVDDFVSGDYVYSLPEELNKKVMSLQDRVAFYVPDSETRKEHSSYFGDDILTNLITQFLK